MIKAKNFSWIDVICIESLLFSGSQVIGRYMSILLMVWVTTCIIAYWKSPVKDKKSLSFNKRVIIMQIIWVLATTLLFHNAITLYWTTYILFPLGAIFANAAYGVKFYREKLLAYLNILLLISLIIHFMHNYGLVPAVQSEDIHKYSYYFFNVEWGTFTLLGNDLFRFSSIYWEPGQLQIVLFYILLLFFDDIRDHIGDIKYIIKKFGLIFISLILTFSTTGFLCLALLMSLLVLRQPGQTSLYKKLFLGLVALYGCSLLLFSDAVQNKVEQKESANEGTSYAIRLYENITAMEITFENPIFGLGIDTNEKQREYNSAGIDGCSNGWLQLSSMCGIPYLLSIIILLFYGTYRMTHSYIDSIIVSSILVLSQANEGVTAFPYVWLYVYKFSRFSLSL